MENQQDPMESLGTILEGDHNRDAIHVAIAPVVAAEKLAPGQDIGFIPEDDTEMVAVTDKPIGIVDPFLKKMVFPEQRFWMLLYPNTITGLRHDWSHPAFESPAKEESETWLRSFANMAGLSYEQLIRIVTNFAGIGEIWIESGSSIAQEALEDVDRVEFWKHVECVTGMKLPEGRSDSELFSWSC